MDEPTATITAPPDDPRTVIALAINDDDSAGLSGFELTPDEVADEILDRLTNAGYTIHPTPRLHTARELLANMGITNPEVLTDTDGAGWDFDRPAAIAPAWSADDGGLRVWCGGQALFTLTWLQADGHRANRSHAYIVIDTRDLDAWQAARRAGSTPTGACPSPRIRLAQAG